MQEQTDLAKHAQGLQEAPDRADDAEESQLVVTGIDPKDALRWSQLFEIPEGRNPVSDDTGEFAVSDETLRGDTLHLGGNLGGETTREFEISEGIHLIVPLISNTEHFLLNARGPQKEQVPTPSEIVKIAQSFLLDNDPDDPSEVQPEIVVNRVFLEVDLDSDGVVDYSLDTDVSGVTYNADNNSVDFSGAADPEKAEEFYVEPSERTVGVLKIPEDDVLGLSAAGNYRTVTNGYFAEVKLPEGTHTVRFGGDVALSDDPSNVIFNVDVTDTITVVDESLLV
jgi:hypothetical protein